MKRDKKLKRGDKVVFPFWPIPPGSDKPRTKELRIGRFKSASGDYHYFRVLAKDNPQMRDGAGSPVPDHEIELYPGEFWAGDLVFMP
jgi:hypothetical protein